MRKYLKIVIFIMISTLFSACTNFYDEYKPLYQAKPIKESIRGEN